MENGIGGHGAQFEFTCNMCCFFADSFDAFRNHTVRYHKDDPNFSASCCIGSCSFTSRNWNTFRSHLFRKHRGRFEIPHPPQDNEPGANNDVYSAISANAVPFSDTQELQHQNALYTLSLQANHNITDSAINHIVSSTSLLLESHTQYVKQRIKEQLAARSIECDFIDRINVDHMLNDLDSSKKRYKAYKQNEHVGYIEPKEIVLGVSHVRKGQKLIEKEKVAYYVPFQKSVSSMLNLPEVWFHVQNPHNSTDDFMYDICDGAYVQNNPFFQQNPHALQIVLNTDDLEIVNPLGSHVKKHKLTVFYFQIANIPPEYRSKLSSIHLLAIGKTVHVREKEGLDLILKDFITVVNRLSGDGIQMTVNGTIHKIQGALVIVPADTLASNWIGGFKESVGFAFKNCRMCDISGSEIKHKLLERDVSLRNDESHKERCTSLGKLSKGSRVYWSKMWGINRASCLLHVTNFSLTSGFVQDPMHVFLEGLLPNELACLLYYFVSTKKITLKWLNSQIRSFQYSYLHITSKPESSFSKVSLEDCKTVKQSSSAMLTLCQVLPLILGPKIPEGDDHWVNFLRLVQILLLCTSTYCHRDTASILRVLTGVYLSTSKVLYPKSSFLPKKHFTIHFPTQMLMYGPLRHHWCMRFEGKHGFFKGKKIKNFKNLPYTLSKHHQLYMCLKQAGSKGEKSSNFLYSGDQVGEGSEFDFSLHYPGLKAEMSNLCQMDPSDEWMMYKTNAVNIHGLQYQVGCAIVLDYVEDDPMFGILREIVIYNGDKYFVFEIGQSPPVFNRHILHYTIIPTGEFLIKSYAGLKFKWPLSIYNYEGMHVTMNVNSHTCEII